MDDLAAGLSATMSLQDPSRAVSRSFSIKRKPLAAPSVPSQPPPAIRSPVQSVISNLVAAPDKADPAQGTHEQADFEKQQKIKYQDGSIFQGKMTEHGVPIHGSITSTLGYVYTGDFDRDGKPSDGKLCMNNRGEGNTEFNGHFRNGLPHQGVLKFDDGRTVEAECDLGGTLTKGKETLPNGEVFVGRFVDNKRMEGTVRYINGDTYTGTFKPGDCRRDKGKMKYRDGSTFDGYWYADKKGNGIYTYPIKEGTASFQGDFDLNGNIRKGTTGIRILPSGRFDGTFYENGNLCKGRHEGSNGITFEGTFNETGGYKEGDLWYPGGSHFYGTFIENLKAQGTYNLAGGDRFEGNFRDGKTSNGKYYFAKTGGIYSGTFQPDGKFINGFLTLPSGTVYDVVNGEKTYNHKSTKANLKKVKEQRRGGGSRQLDPGTADRVRGEINQMVDTSMFWQRYNNC